MELERRIYEELTAWSQLKEKKAILLYGVRQCGKTHIVRKLGKEKYKSFIEINFIDSPEFRKVFEGDLSADAIITGISAMKTGVNFTDGETLLFLDEIQECPNAITALKFLAFDRRFDCIASGSLLGLTYRKLKSFPVGYVDEKRMYPLTFREFASASGLAESVLSYLEECFTEQKKVSQAVHSAMLNLFRTYLLAGGMPEVVSSFLENRNFENTAQMQEALHRQYTHDIIKYADKDENKIRQLYLQVPSSLSSGGVRFMLSEISRNARYERYESGFQWLYDSGTVLPCFNVKEPAVPLKTNADMKLQKLFLSDTGLLCSLTIRKAYFDLLQGNDSANLGFIFENIIAQELTASGIDLFYYNRKGIGEIDFLIQDGLEIIPVEVKSGKYFKNHQALNNLMAIKNYPISKAYVLSSGNIEREGNIINLPWYMTMFLNLRKSSEHVDMSYLDNLENLIR